MYFSPIPIHSPSISAYSYHPPVDSMFQDLPSNTFLNSPAPFLPAATPPESPPLRRLLHWRRRLPGKGARPWSKGPNMGIPCSYGIHNMLTRHRRHKIRTPAFFFTVGTLPAKSDHNRVLCLGAKYIPSLFKGMSIA